MSIQSASNFLTAEQLKRLRVFRVARYVWRRRFRPWFIANYSQGMTHRSQRRLWLSVLLFAGALGLTLWIDVARIRLNLGAQAINPTPTFSATPLPTPTPSAVPQKSIDRFQEFSRPAVSKSTTPVPDKLPQPQTTTEASPTASENAPSPSANPRPTVTPQTPPVTPNPTSSGSVSPTPAPPTPSPTPAPFHPPSEVAWAHPSNYGDRFSKDINNKLLTEAPIIVLHETVYSADSAINYFQTPHSNEDDQASYHTLIRLDGTVIYIVPPEKRAFGAGNSVFVGKNGEETAKTHAQYAPSVNNFAYHISLETPIDGENDNETHSGYTEAQYRSLVWLVDQSTVPEDRITTHRAIDRSQSRIDPRSFDTPYFLSLLRQQRSSSKLPINLATRP